LQDLEKSATRSLKRKAPPRIQNLHFFGGDFSHLWLSQVIGAQIKAAESSVDSFAYHLSKSLLLSGIISSTLRNRSRTIMPEEKSNRKTMTNPPYVNPPDASDVGSIGICARASWRKKQN
jgi:hypothetical protein